jgi:16S rRNA (cytidine1402-2'-O)-methyltransferase
MPARRVEAPRVDGQDEGAAQCCARLGIIVGKLRGRLQVIATPIGNLNDLSARARESLESADVIAAEDTRHTLVLLQSIGVSRPLVSLHAHNETQRVPELLARLEAGETVALVSDAGTPLLSDPGFELVREAARAGHDVYAIPGPSAITAALAVAGLPTSRFCFEGFLPARDSERRSRLAQLAGETRTLVFFEAPHRILQMLADLVSEFGADRRAVVAREMTKAHETVYRGTVGELATLARDEPNFQRGEITIVVEGCADVDTAVDTRLLHLAVELLSKELPAGRAASIVAKLTGAKRSEVYTLLTRESEARRDER